MNIRTNQIGRLLWFGLVAFLGLPMISLARLSPLGKVPDWSTLELYQKTITHDEFYHLINKVYSVNGAFWHFTDADAEEVKIYSDLAHSKLLFTLKFADSDSDNVKKPPYSYHTQAFSKNSAQPLQGICIALDPGHIGGDWAQLEERYFKTGEDPPVEEAQLNMTTCQILAQLLEADGARVVWAKKGYEPVTPLRPESLRGEARAWLQDLHLPQTDHEIDRRAALLFYRIAEIRARAEKVNALHPDATVCIHYNADDWGNPSHPTLTKYSRLIIFTNGSYDTSELVYDDVKYDLLRKLLDRTAASEQKGCALIGQKMLDALKYPPETEVSYSSHRITSVPSVYSRNLLANRLYHGPVFYCEGPYMNAQDAYPRLIAGDYLGEKEIHGQKVRSIFREYATAVESGLLAYFGIDR